MHKSIFTENQELSIIQVDDNYLTKNEKPNLYDQCKNNTRQKIDVVNQGMLVFLTINQKKKTNSSTENCKIINNLKNHKYICY